jgi:hypothetical protein
MPIHDWTRAPDFAFHSFQHGWVVEASRRLNKGLLPRPLYSMTETIDLRPQTGFHNLPEPKGPVVSRHSWEERLTDADEQPPRSAFQSRDDQPQYACRLLTVRDDLHQPLAAIVWITDQDKRTPYRLEAITGMATAALTRGIHLLVIDLFPPLAQEPKSIHELIWARARGVSLAMPSDQPLTVASYDAGNELTAYVDPLAVGDPLPDAPLEFRRNSRGASSW